MLAPATRWLRETALGIDLDDVDLMRRGFCRGEPSAHRMLSIPGRAFRTGYMQALRDPSSTELVACLNLAPIHERGFQFEGAAMALRLLDQLSLSRASRWTALLARAERHPYTVHIGGGWALARMNLPARAALDFGDPHLRWLAVDGMGFHEGYFRADAYKRGRGRYRRLAGYAARAFDQGFGRSLWFANGADPSRIALAVSAMSEFRHPDLWSGIGLAAAYAGGARAESLLRLRIAAGGNVRWLAQGAAFATEAKILGGELTPHAEHACRALCAEGPQKVVEIVRAARPRGTARDDGQAYEGWRQKIASQLSQLPALR